MTTEPSTPALAEYFTALGDVLNAGNPGGPRPRDLVDVALSAIDGAEFGGLTLLVHEQRPRSLAATDDVVVAVDDMQYALRQGPCWDASTGHVLIRADDLEASREWPQFGPRCAAETGIHSMLSVRLSLTDGDGAALNCYARQPHAFTARDSTVAAMFAPFTTLALQAEVNADKVGHLQTALLNSRQIGTAVGILMSRELITAERAFERLVEASQYLNEKLRDVAERVVLTGEVPTDRRAAADRRDR